MGYIEKIEGNNSLKAGVGMNVNELKKIIESGEKINVEFKLSENDLTKDVYQRYVLLIIVMEGILFLA